MGRGRGVVAELHRELALALGGGAEVGGEAEHGVEGAVGDHGELVSGDLGVDDGAALVHQHQNVTLELGRRRDGGLHEGLEHLTASSGEGLAEGHLRGQVEGVIGRIGNVRGTVGDDHGRADDLVAEQGTLDAGLLETLRAGRDVLVGDGAADHPGLEVVLLAAVGVWFDPAHDTGVITGTAGLALEKVVELGLLGDGLAVRDAGLAGLALDLVLTAETLDVNLEMQLTHTADDGLLGLLVNVEAESGILTHKAVHGLGEGIGVAGTLGLDAERHDGVGDVHGAQGVRKATVGEGIARSAVNTEDGANLTSTDLVDVLHFIGVHTDDTGNADLLVAAGVVEVGALLERTLVDTHVGELAVRVLFELEGKTDEGEGVVGNELDGLLALGAVERKVVGIVGVREVVANSVEHGLDTPIGNGRTHEDGGKLAGDSSAANGGLDLLGARGLLLEEHLGNLIVHIGKLLDKLLSLLLAEVLDLSGNLLGDLEVDTTHAIVTDALHLDQVDDTLELLLRAERNLDSGSGDLELVVDLLDRLPGVGTHTIHLVDEGDTGDVVALHLSVDGNGLGLDTGDGAENHDGTVKHSHGTLDLDGEVDMAGGIDQVDVVGLLDALLLLLPVGKGGGRLDGDTSLSFEFHGIHLGADTIATTDLVDGLDSAGVEKNALGDGGLAGIDVGLYVGSCLVSVLVLVLVHVSVLGGFLFHLGYFRGGCTYGDTNVTDTGQSLGLFGGHASCHSFRRHVGCGEFFGLLETIGEHIA